MAEHTILTFKDAPRGAKVYKVLSKQQVYCDNNVNQEHTVPASAWIDLGLEWEAIDMPSLLTTWPFITLAITVDGEEIDHPKQNSNGPYENVVQCANETHIGYAMINALCIPPLPVGDHTIVWTIGFERDVDDGWTNYPQGKELVLTSRVHVVKTS